MQPALLDTSVYIRAIRRGDKGVLDIRRLSSGSVIWLSSVVLEELYAGSSERSVEAVERLERDFERARRVLVPNLTDWVQAGKTLARLAARYDYQLIGRGRVTNDALIAVSAGRMGVRVITANARDFQKMAEFRPFLWELAKM